MKDESASLGGRPAAASKAWRCSSASRVCPRACAVLGCIIVISSGAELSLLPRMPLRPGGPDRVIAQDLGPRVFSFPGSGAWSSV